LMPHVIWRISHTPSLSLTISFLFTPLPPAASDQSATPLHKSDQQ
jgi:hypothetical protein